ncbi:MAG: hypothetical protein EHM41_08710 [Chloroflexi bacterium]|nr:MAG: hypothetical protein EHM41_08710 [Chloroflexota bacterium]
MERREFLLKRLDDIGFSLEKSGSALALIGLGSVGTELDRLDQFSDLDFFAVVKPGFKGDFLKDLSWLSSICPVVYYFQNTPDGFKLLYEDGVFCEFAVFEPHELTAIPFQEGRIVWKDPGVDESIRFPKRESNRGDPLHSMEWSLGEAITCLYVGLARYQRGEKLSAQRFIQGYAVDRLLELWPYIEAENKAARDPFSPERRFEERFPEAAEQLPLFIQGYERSPESAKAILDFLERHFQVNSSIKSRILEICVL